MPTEKTFGMAKVPYLIFTYDELTKLGIAINPNMYIGNGFMFCANCNKYTYHFAMSSKSGSDCYELCKDCDSYVAPRVQAVLKGLVA